MTQALQIPMLMLSSDTMLKPDSLAASGDTSSYESSQGGADEAAAFGQLLSDMVEPGKNGKASVGQRQIPAGVASLSSLSVALRHSETAEPADDSLLANNLLQQIALVLQGYREDGSDHINETDTAADTELSDTAMALAQQARVIDADSSETVSRETDKTKSAPDTLLKGEPEATGLKAELIKAKHHQRNSSAGEVADSGKELIQKAISETETSERIVTALNTSDNSQSIDVDVDVDVDVASTKKLSKRETLAKGIDLTSAKATELRESEDHNNIAHHVSESVLTDSLTKTKKINSVQLNFKQPVNDDIAKSSVLGQKSVTADSDGETVAAEEVSIVQTDGTLDAEVTRASIAEQTILATKAEDKSVSKNIDVSANILARDINAEKDNLVTPADSAVLRSVPSPAATANVQATVARNATEPVSDGAQQKAQTMLHAAQSDNGAAAEGDSQQQNPAERQLSSELQNAFSRTGNDSSQTRMEQTFASTLQHIQQTTRSTDSSRPQLKTASEQLQQNLNLQQHDATGQLRERVNLMVRQNIQIAEIRLDPAGLGQMQIKVDVQQDQTNVQFVVQQSQAKELIEQQLPRLREMLQQQGIVLGEGSVQQQSQQERQLAQGQQQQHGQTGSQQGDAADGMTADGATAQVKVAVPDRLVDYYA